ncbi:MAG: YggT family protein [Acidimicrobiales bacterium]
MIEIHYILLAYELILLARIVLSWFPLSPGSPVWPASRVLHAVTEPVLAPIRRVLPPIGVGGMGFDLSPIVVLVVLGVLINRL